MNALRRIRETMRVGRPLADGPGTLDLLNTVLRQAQVRAPASANVDSLSSVQREAMRLLLVEKSALQAGAFGDVKIAATSVPIDGTLGWRITATEQSTGIGHEFFVYQGQIHHVKFHASPPWSHQTPFVIGARVKRISAHEKRAIVQFLAGVGSRTSLD